MLHTLVHELAVETLVLVGVCLFEIAQVVGLETIVFRSRESEFSGTTGFRNRSGHRSFHLSVFRQDSKFEGVYRFREQILTIAGRGLQERTLRFFCIFFQTVVDHREGCVLHIVRDDKGQCSLQRIGECLMLHENLDDIILLLLVLVDHEDGLGIVWHGIGCHLCGILRQYDGREQVLDLLLHLVHIDITHDDDGLIVRTIPFLIISLQEGALKIVDDLHQSDRHTIAVLRTRIELGQVALQHTHLG